MIISSNTGNLQGRIDGEKIQFVLQMLRGETNDIMREIGEWIRRGQGED